MLSGQKVVGDGAERFGAFAEALELKLGVGNEVGGELPGFVESEDAGES
jgi:hypothetical protein